MVTNSKRKIKSEIPSEEVPFLHAYKNTKAVAYLHIFIVSFRIFTFAVVQLSMYFARNTFKMDPEPFL